MLQAVNNKTCCGSVKWIGPWTLAPGQAGEFEVTIRLGGTIGPLSHYATVETDDPSEPWLEFWTLANVHPEIRIEDAPGESRPLLSGGAVARRFKAFSYGTAADPPIALEKTEIKSALGAHWVDSASERSLEGGVIEQSRTFEVELRGQGEPGPRKDEIKLVGTGRELLTHVISWEVLPALKASPSSLILALGETKNVQSVLLRATDQTEFAITEIECGTRGIDASVKQHAKSAIQQIDVRCDANVLQAGTVATIVVRTDHPAQGTVKIPLLVTGASESAPTREESR